MKKVILGFGAVAIVAMSSCEKFGIDSDGDGDMITSESAAITLQEGGFEIIEVSALEKGTNEDYTAGTIQYVKDGVVLATVDFGTGEDDEVAMCTANGEEFEIPLRGQYCGKKWDHKKKKGFWKKKKGMKGKKGNWKEVKKVIVTPLVKAEECQEIVCGTMKFYDIETGDWLATVDFGDGTCDDTFTKTTPDGSENLSFSEYFHK